jgi:hypothetical protein
MSFDHLGRPSIDVGTVDWTLDACTAIPLAALQRKAWEAKGSTICRARPAPQQSPEIPTIRTSIRCSSQCNYQLERMSSAGSATSSTPFGEQPRVGHTVDFARKSRLAER